MSEAVINIFFFLLVTAGPLMMTFMTRGGMSGMDHSAHGPILSLHTIEEEAYISLVADSEVHSQQAEAGTHIRG